MRRKYLPILALMAGLLGLFLAFRWHDRRWDPILSGKPMSHWLDVLDGNQSAKAEQEEAIRILRETDQRAALQSRILDRIEDRYSSLAIDWYQFYMSVSPRVRRHVPVPQFARIDLRVLSLLNGISTNTSPRQTAAMETVIRFGVYLQALDVAYGVALSEATQAPAEALSMARRELGSPDPVRRLGVCEAIRAKNGLDGWRSQGELVNGLKADLARLVAGDPVSEVAVAAHKALEHLEIELNAKSIKLQAPLTDRHEPPPDAATKTDPRKSRSSGQLPSQKPALNPGRELNVPERL